MSRIAEMRERIKARQGDKTEAQIEQSVKIANALTGNSNKRGHKVSHTDATKAKIKNNHSKYWQGKKRPDIAKYVKPGTEHPSYGRGRIYKELSTGFEGTVTDMETKFGIDNGSIIMYAKRGTPLKRGKNKGLHFVVQEVA